MASEGGEVKELEKDIQKKILIWLGLKGIFAWTNKTQGTFDPVRRVFRTSNQLKGVPDILGVLPDGRFLGIEVKRKGGIVSPEQSAFIGKASRLGALCFVAYSVDDVIQNLKSYVNKPPKSVAEATAPTLTGP